jgi:hypothetical protein
MLSESLSRFLIMIFRIFAKTLYSKNQLLRLSVIKGDNEKFELWQKMYLVKS